jgi:hypothetical protein
MSDVEAMIAALDGLFSQELRARWRGLTATPVPRVGPRLLGMALVWEIQAGRLGGHGRETTRLLDYNDQRIHHDGRAHGSLSGVARAITGTRWSGPGFFGLKRRTAA